jgi:hypothetical protein
LFASLQSQGSPVLLELLEVAYDAMTVDQQNGVFRKANERAKPLSVKRATLLT